MKPIQIVECPRDAMQGVKEWIPTELKIKYLNQLLKLGVHTLDFGSFVSPKAIPQLADTVQVLSNLDLSHTQTQLLAIVANTRGASEACHFQQINYIGFPYSVSETFQMRNTNKTMAESWIQVEEMQNLCLKHNKTLVVYLSMAFGNPYGDSWDTAILSLWTEKLAAIGVTIVSLADTIGSAHTEDIQSVFSELIPTYPQLTIGAHFHATPNQWKPKIEAAYHAGCRRFDGALKGFGGCPFADDHLTGNIATENIVSFLQQQGEWQWTDNQVLLEAFKLCNEVFSHA